MNIIVPIKLVPDLVEELTIDESGSRLDDSWLSLILNEFDEQALEQALLLKEKVGGQVTIVALDDEELDDVFYTAAAKGVDRLIRLTGDFERGMNNHALARVLVPIIRELSPDLVLTGVQAHDDLDGQLGPLLAGYLETPYVGYVASVSATDGQVTVSKEYPGGLTALMEVTLPAVLGIQAAEKPPRYVAFGKVRQVMKMTTIEERPVGEPDPSGGVAIDRMFKPEVGERAIMIEGEVEDIAARLLEIIEEEGVL